MTKYALSHVTNFIAAASTSLIWLMPMAAKAQPVEPPASAQEEAEEGRFGLELYYTGQQPLDGNPYRDTGKPYIEMGFLGEMVIEKARLFINAESILTVRQTKTNPFVLRNRAPDGRWTVDAWAPNKGFVVNGGVRFAFGGA